jgi:hypothetical protein
MLQIQREADETLVLVSDDKNAENDALSTAIDEGAPHLLKAWEDTEMGDDGLLRFYVQKPDWLSLLDVIELLSDSGAVDPDDILAIDTVLNNALDE